MSLRNAPVGTAPVVKLKARPQIDRLVSGESADVLQCAAQGTAVQRDHAYVSSHVTAAGNPLR